jgi:hypothetical protein
MDPMESTTRTFHFSPSYRISPAFIPAGDLTNNTGNRKGVDDNPVLKDHQEKLADLTENVAGEIRNPLRGIPREQLLDDVTNYHHGQALREEILPLLKMGALVAQNPAQFEQLADLDEEEKHVLREEVTHRWKHPWALYYTIILSSVAAAIQGWDQVCSPCATLCFFTPKLTTSLDRLQWCQLDLPRGAGHSRYRGFILRPRRKRGRMFQEQLDHWLCQCDAVHNHLHLVRPRSLRTVHLLMYRSACWISDPLNDLLGRRGVIFIAAIFSLLAPFGMAVSQTWGQLAACR